MAASRNSPNFTVYAWAGATAWQLAESALAVGRCLYLWGPPGVGKSYIAIYAARIHRQITLNEDTTVPELMGHYIPQGDVFLWHDGPVSRAMRDGALLVLNEIGRASGAVQDFLLGALDGPDVALLTLPTGESLKPAPGFTVVATSNSSPETLDHALRSRFEVEIHLTEPNPALIARFNQTLRGLGDVLRDSFQDPERALDPRRLLSFAGFIKAGVPARQAAVMAVGDRAPDLIAVLSTRGIRLG